MLELIYTIIGIAMFLTLLALVCLCGMLAPLLIDHEACKPAPGSNPRSDPGSEPAPGSCPGISDKHDEYFPVLDFSHIDTLA